MKDIGFHKRNETGLTNAYKANNNIYIKGDTMFLAGTSNLQDVWDDLKIDSVKDIKMLIIFWRRTRRFKI